MLVIAALICALLGSIAATGAALYWKAQFKAIVAERVLAGQTIVHVPAWQIPSTWVIRFSCIAVLLGCMYPFYLCLLGAGVSPEMAKQAGYFIGAGITLVIGVVAFAGIITGGD